MKKKMIKTIIVMMTVCILGGCKNIPAQIETSEIAYATDFTKEQTSEEGAKKNNPVEIKAEKEEKDVTGKEVKEVTYENLPEKEGKEVISTKKTGGEKEQKNVAMVTDVSQVPARKGATVKVPEVTLEEEEPKKLEEEQKQMEAKKQAEEQEQEEKKSETPSEKAAVTPPEQQTETQSEKRTSPPVPTPELIEQWNKEYAEEVEKENERRKQEGNNWPISVSANRAVFDEINAYRVENGLEPLAWGGADMEGIGSVRAYEQTDLVVNKYQEMNHAFGTPWNGLENLCGGGRREGAFESWRTSPGHNMTMLRPELKECVVYTGYYEVTTQGRTYAGIHVALFR